MDRPPERSFAAVEHALRRIAEAVARDARAGEVYALAAREAAALFGVPFGLVGRVDPDAGEMVVVGASERDAGPGEVAVPRALAGSFAERVVDAGTPLRELLGPDDPGYGTRGERVAAPISVEGRTWGLVGVASPSGARVPDGAERELARFADLLALAIRAGADRERARRRLRQQEALAALAGEALRGQPLLELFETTARVLAAEVGSTGATVAELVGDGDFVTVAVSGPAVAARLGVRTARSTLHAGLERGEAIVVHDFAADPERRELAEQHGLRSAVIAPIPGGPRPYGVVSALDARAGAFSEEDRGFVAAIANIVAAAVERAATEDRIRHDALHDGLTGAVNRTLLMDRIGHALQRAVDDEHRVALLFVNVDRLQAVNEAHGHAAGDRLLATVASRLREAMRPGDTLGRIGGDDFAIVCEAIASERGAVAVAQRLAAAVSEPDDAERVSVSIGVALCTAAEDPEYALRNANAAMHRAKRGGGNAVELFDTDLRRRLVTQLELDRGLRRAIAQGELVLHFQPIVRLADLRIESFEALVRWAHPRHGLLPPGHFIGFAEETGLIREIGAFAVRAACAAAAAWNAEAPDARPTGVTVNVSARQLEAGDLVELVDASLDEWGLDPGQLGVEITESVLLEHTAGSVEQLDRLRTRGVRVLLDDFGTGYSSLAYLRRFPLDVLKLDRVFVDGVGRDARDGAIVAAVLGMTDALGLEAVAEGVERVEQLPELLALGCTFAQGYCFARPLPRAEATALLRDAPVFRLP